jgi:putative Mg2+ transporter-C (MgtC) family protein
MPTTLPWSDIAIRIFCATLSGALLGLNRTQHGRAAGLRTMILVSLAAALSMIQVNLLLPIAGKPDSSFVTLDLMRLPLGILSGIGFIGAGAIVRHGSFVVGVTTAATIWFTTVIGLCFGAGQIALGFVGLAIGITALVGLKFVESRIKQEHQGKLLVVTDSSGPREEEIRLTLKSSGLTISSCAFSMGPETPHQTLTYDIRWRADARAVGVPDVIRSLAEREGITRVAWTPQPE